MSTQGELLREQRVKRMAQALVLIEQEHSQRLSEAPVSTPGLYHFMADRLITMFDATQVTIPASHASNSSNASDASNASNDGNERRRKR